MEKRAKALILLAALVAGGLGWFLGEYALYGRRWALATGNPHLSRGLVVDANGVVLRQVGRGYPADEALRRAVVHWVGDPAGRVHTPVLRHYEGRMTVYHPVTGLYAFSESVMELTLRHRVQMAARDAMEGRRGTVAVYNYETGEILCAVSAPDFDPGGEGQAREGQYLNRFLQGQYTPGSIFKTVTAGAALAHLPDILEQRFHCSGKATYGNGTVTCEKAHGELDLYGAMAQSCNCAFARIAQQLGAGRLLDFVDQCGITKPIAFDGATSAPGRVRTDGSEVALAWSGIGQHEDLVNPARFLAFMGAIARGGAGIDPYIVGKITRDGKTVYRGKGEESARILSADVAGQLQKLLRNNVKTKYGDQHFSGLTLCAKTGTAQTGREQPNAMLAGFVCDERLPVAFFVAVEEGGYGAKTCIPIVSRVLSACLAEKE